MSFQPRRGAAHVTNGAWRRVSYSDSEWKEAPYLDEHDRPDEEDSPQAALARVLRALIDELPTGPRECVLTYFFDTRGVFTVQHGKDSGLRAATRALVVNPRTGKPIDKKTVKKYIQQGLALLHARIVELPDWQRELVARSLQPGTLPAGDALVLPPGLPDDFPGGISE